MALLVFFVCLAASVVGGVCGIGGGVVIKPVLDAMGIMSVSAVSFLSGITVLSMSGVSLALRRRKEAFEPGRCGWLLAAGAAVGGVLGQQTFAAIRAHAGQDVLLGLLQAVLLALVTLATLLYTLFIHPHHHGMKVTNPLACLGLGLALGVCSAFLGIGGGPLNLAVLYAFFDMSPREAGNHSLNCIFLSQTASLITTLLTGSLPAFSPAYLVLMAAAGVLGGRLGTRLHRRLSDGQCAALFSMMMGVIIAICLYNAARFGALL